MLPQDITDLASRMLPLIAQSTDHYSYHGSGLKSKEWDLLRTRLLADGLATSLNGELLQLTPEGHEVVSKGPRGYVRFRRKRERELGDTLLTNLFSRYGAIATIAATGIALWALLKPDGNDEKVKELERVQIVTQAKLTSVTSRLQVLANKQDSLAHIIAKGTKSANSSPSASHAIVPSSQAEQAIPGKAASRKRR